MVHFVLSVAYASAEAIGLDPTIVRSCDGQSYDIILGSQNSDPRTYRTCGLLFFTGKELLSTGEELLTTSIELHGRMTRVWKAVRVKDGREVGEPVVLKDTWVNAPGPFEGDVLADLVADLPEDERLKIRGHLPSVECHGNVYPYNDRTTADSGCIFAVSDDLSEQWSDTRGQPLWYRAITQKKDLVHYRIVFKDVCKPLDKETSLAAVFRALSQIALSTHCVPIQLLKPTLVLFSVADYTQRRMGSSRRQP